MCHHMPCDCLRHSQTQGAFSSSYSESGFPCDRNPTGIMWAIGQEMCAHLNEIFGQITDSGFKTCLAKLIKSKHEHSLYYL